MNSEWIDPNKFQIFYVKLHIILTFAIIGRNKIISLELDNTIQLKGKKITLQTLLNYKIKKSYS